MNRPRFPRLQVESLERRDLLALADEAVDFSSWDDTQLEPTYAVPTYTFPTPRPVQTVIFHQESHITAEVIGGTLRIRGDDEGVWVRVIQRGEGKFSVTSGLTLGGGAFIVAIDGCGNGSPTFDGVTAIVIEMGAGD